uniref:Uncharacterized protein n=1 Tax=Oryza rufipogon TaxID=4529 RepID=A0A0E0Q4H2_ORYRU
MERRNHLEPKPKLNQPRYTTKGERSLFHIDPAVRARRRVEVRRLLAAAGRQTRGGAVAVAVDGLLFEHLLWLQAARNKGMLRYEPTTTTNLPPPTCRRSSSSTCRTTPAQGWKFRTEISISLFEECIMLDRALEEMQKKDSKIVDKLSFKEQMAYVLLKVGRFEEAEKTYRSMLFMNPDNYKCFIAIQKCLGLYSENGQYSTDDVDRLCTFYSSLKKEYGWSSVVKAARLGSPQPLVIIYP